MALNYPGPFTLKIFQTNTANGGIPLQHMQQFNIDIDGDPAIGTPFADIDVLARVVAVHPLATVVDEYINHIRPLFSDTETTFTHAELWKNVPDTFIANYVSAYTINVAGAAVTANDAGQETILTFRTYEGNMMRCHLLETQEHSRVVTLYADLTQDEKDIVDFIVGDADSFFLGRDTSYPALFLRWLPGQNETIFKKRYRP